MPNVITATFTRVYLQNIPCYIFFRITSEISIHSYLSCNEEEEVEVLHFNSMNHIIWYYFIRDIVNTKPKGLKREHIHVAFPEVHINYTKSSTKFWNHWCVLFSYFYMEIAVSWTSSQVLCDSFVPSTSRSRVYLYKKNCKQ